jgi:phosphatidate cytidylyltransferase
MEQLVKRSVSGLIYAAVILLAVFNPPYGPVFLALFLGSASLLEWLQLQKKQRTSRSTALLLGIYFLLIYRFSDAFNLAPNDLQFSELLIAILFVSFVLAAAFSKKEKAFPNLFSNVFGLFYVALPLCLLTQIYVFRGQPQPWLLAGIFVLIWFSDSFAYLTGKYLGKHKLAPKISPNKTWEGFIGGAIATLVFATIAPFTLGILPLWAWLGLALVVIVFGAIGDLFESALKRHYQIKDSGNFMPGHGGMLDRIDSLLLATPMAYFYLQAIQNYC